MFGGSSSNVSAAEELQITDERELIVEIITTDIVKVVTKVMLLVNLI